MRKEKEYIPQFADIEQPKERKLKKCVICNKESVSLHNGVCFECRKKQDFSYRENAKLKPNEEQFILYMEGKTSDKIRWLLPGIIYKPFLKYGLGVWLILLGIDWAVVGFFIFEGMEMLFAIIFGIVSVIVGILLIKSHKERIYKKFEKFNNSIIEINDEGWICPCCGFANIQKYHCERCGVLPNFREKK